MKKILFIFLSGATSLAVFLLLTQTKSLDFIKIFIQAAPISLIKRYDLFQEKNPWNSILPELNKICKVNNLNSISQYNEKEKRWLPLNNYELNFHSIYYSKSYAAYTSIVQCNNDLTVAPIREAQFLLLPSMGSGTGIELLSGEIKITATNSASFYIINNIGKVFIDTKENSQWTASQGKESLIIESLFGINSIGFLPSFTDSSIKLLIKNNKAYLNLIVFKNGKNAIIVDPNRAAALNSKGELKY